MTSPATVSNRDTSSAHKTTSMLRRRWRYYLSIHSRTKDRSSESSQKKNPQNPRFLFFFLWLNATKITPSHKWDNLLHSSLLTRHRNYGTVRLEQTAQEMDCGVQGIQQGLAHFCKTAWIPDKKHYFYSTYRLQVALINLFIIIKYSSSNRSLLAQIDHFCLRQHRHAPYATFLKASVMKQCKANVSLGFSALPNALIATQSWEQPVCVLPAGAMLFTCVCWTSQSWVWHHCVKNSVLSSSALWCAVPKHAS